jgi:hypothetical protein
MGNLVPDLLDLAQDALVAIVGLGGAGSTHGSFPLSMALKPLRVKLAICDEWPL